jgi:hypothetical protein
MSSVKENPGSLEIIARFAGADILLLFRRAMVHFMVGLCRGPRRLTALQPIPRWIGD